MSLNVMTATAVNAFLKGLLLLVVIAVFVPFSPKMPSLGLDNSWALGLNHAVAAGLAFGREIIFTLGPYSSIYTKAYHPQTDLMMISGSLYLACCYWFALLILMKEAQWYGVLAYCIFLAGMLYARDSLLFSYPLLLGLICFESKAGAVLGGKFNPPVAACLIALLFAPLGLLMLIKGTVLMLSLAVAVLCSIFFLIYGHRFCAILALFVPVCSALLFWLGSGQSLVNVPAYFINTLIMSLGFTEAMASDGNVAEIFFYLLTAGLILIVILSNRQWHKAQLFYLLSLCFIFLFISLKAGFVRHYGHAFIASTSILMASFLLSFILPRRKAALALMCSFACWYFINSHYTSISLYKNFFSTYSAAWHGFKNRVNDGQWLRKNYVLAMNFIKAQSNFPALSGTTDVYSYHQTELIATQNTWLPRPVFQSYSVFTASLAQKNKQHLQGQQAPDNIIFSMEPIDGRIPSLEDGPSWITLLTHYKLVVWNARYLVLNKQPEADFIRQSRHSKHALGEKVTLTAHQQLVFLKIELRLSIWGRLFSILFKPDPLYITVTLENGRQIEYRLVANMARAGFLLSPLIENTKEFGLLFQENDLFKEKKVASFVIRASKANTIDWHHKYVAYFKLLH